MRLRAPTFASVAVLAVASLPAEEAAVPANPAAVVVTRPEAQASRPDPPERDVFEKK